MSWCLSPVPFVPRSVYEDLVSKGVIEPAEEVPPPTVPMDYSWARVSCNVLFHPVYLITGSEVCWDAS